MALFSEEIHTMDDLFLHTLEDIYYAEHQIEKALPDMMEKATDSELKRGISHPSGRDQETDQTPRSGVQEA